MSWAVLERLELALHADPTLSAPMRALVEEAADYIREQQAVVDDLSGIAEEADDAETAFASLVRDIKDVLTDHGV